MEGPRTLNSGPHLKGVFFLEVAETVDVLEDDDRWMFSQRFILHPHSARRRIWDAFGLFLFGYDAVAVPLQSFPLSDVLFINLMDWVIRVWMFIDFFLSFVTGYVQGDSSVVDMRVWSIAKHYSKSWMVFDLTILIFSLAEIINHGDDSGSITIISRMVRFVRVTRGLKLLRTITMPQWMNRASYVRTERLKIMLSIVKVIAGLVWFTHCNACGWYAVGAAFEESWLDAYGIRRETYIFIYTASLHWAISGFSGSLEINPVSEIEHLYCCFSLVATFTIGIVIVSGITTHMTQFQIITADRSKAIDVLQKFLLNQGVSKSLSMHIQLSATKAMEERARNIEEAGVELLQMVSEPLRIELHYEANATIFTEHPFFKFYDAVFPLAMKELCHRGVSHQRAHPGDLIFSHGVAPEDPKMFFLVKGNCSYSHMDVTLHPVKMGEWTSETALWSVWTHHGTLRARSDATLALLHADMFRKIFSQFMTQEPNPLNYTRSFMKHLNSLTLDQHTDLQLPGSDAYQWAEDAFGDDERCRHLKQVKRHSMRKPSVAAGTAGYDSLKRQSNENARRFSISSLSSGLFSNSSAVNKQSAEAKNLTTSSVAPQPEVKAKKQSVGFSEDC